MHLPVARLCRGLSPGRGGEKQEDGGVNAIRAHDSLPIHICGHHHDTGERERANEFPFMEVLWANTSESWLARSRRDAVARPVQKHTATPLRALSVTSGCGVLQQSPSRPRDLILSLPAALAGTAAARHCLVLRGSCPRRSTITTMDRQS